MMTHITTEAGEDPIRKIALNMGVEDINLFTGEEINDPSIYMVFLNGKTKKKTLLNEIISLH